MDYIKNFDYKSKNSKLAASFIIPAILFFIMSPGTLFEINTEDKMKKSCKNKYSTVAIHSVIFGFLIALFYYFYLGKKFITNI